VTAEKMNDKQQTLSSCQSGCPTMNTTEAVRL